MLLNNTIHLSYCSNIHPGENWSKTFGPLRNNLPKIKAEISPNRDFGVGLRLSNLASKELSQGTNLIHFKDWLKENDLYVYTMNGFPYGNFHGERVKENVHAPDWTTPERLEYTLRLFNQLGRILPNGIEGGVSTSPISYKHWHKGEVSIDRAFRSGAKNMVQLALKLYQLEQEMGVYMHLDVEPEPDGLLEDTVGVIRFFEHYLVPMARKEFGAIGTKGTRAEELLKRYITICYDICHFSLAYEEPENTFVQFASKGINVGKIQISAALKIISQPDEYQAIWNALKAFDEPTYLHQVTENKKGSVTTYADLSQVLTNKDKFNELRAHFHVPIFMKDFGLLRSTQDHIVKTMDYLKKHPQLTKHLEVETYTWDVLPEPLKVPLTDSVVRELNWVKERMV